MPPSNHIHFYESCHNGETLYHAVVGIELRSCPSARLFYDRYMKHDENSITDRFSNFIACLHQSDLDISYTIRMIVNPIPDNYSSGNIKFILFLRTSAEEKSIVEKQINDLQSQMLNLLGGFFGDYDWYPIKDAQHFISVWSSTNWHQAHFAEITRHQQWIELDRIRKFQPLGFLQTDTRAMDSPENDRIYYLSPFLPSKVDFEQMIQTLLLLSSQTILNISISPTFLRNEEWEQMQDVVARCEDPAFLEHAEKKERVYDDRAHVLLKALMNQFEQLATAPWDVRILIASPQPFQSTILNAVGGYISSFTQGQRISLTENPFGLQEGGFTIRRFTGEREIQQAISHLVGLDVAAWEDPIAPENLQRLKWLFCAREAVCAFRFPVATDQNLPGMSVHDYRMQPPPPEIAELDKVAREQRCLLGFNDYLGQKMPVFFLDKDRNRHMYIIGQTGTGKTTLLKNMILSDMKRGKGLAVIDPHGDLFEELLTLIPKNRIDDVVLIDPQDMSYPVGFNLLECSNEGERYFIVREMRTIMDKYLRDRYAARMVDYAGPIFYKHMQMNMLLVMSDPARAGTLLEFYEIFNNKDYWKKWLPLKWDDSQLKNWIEVVLPATDYVLRRNPQEASFGEYINSKFDDFVFDPRLRLIFGQHRSTINISDIIEKKKILLVNLAKGVLGEANANFLGMILIAKIQSEILKRASLASTARHFFYLYVDEFQSLASQNFSSLLSEGRKFGLALTLVNQYLTQIEEQHITDAIFGNVGTLISFRVGQNDAQKMENLFLPEIERDDLCDLPNWTSAVRASCNGVNVAPFFMRNIYREKQGDEHIAQIVRVRSRQKYGVQRSKVEKEIEESVRMIELND